MSDVGGRRKRWFVWLARRYVRSRLRRSFDGLFVAGLERAQHLVASGPVIVASTHTAWWDALTIIYLDELIGSHGYCWMDAANLSQMPFFAWTGAIPIDREQPRAALSDLDAGAELLGPAHRALWIFPQGRQRRTSVRPLGLKSGVARIARTTGATVLPLSLDYAYREREQPAVVAHFGEPMRGHGNTLMRALESQLVGGIERIDAFVDGDDRDFNAVIEPRHHKRVPWAGRLLGTVFAKGGDR